jgi:hypothetical protein
MFHKKPKSWQEFLRPVAKTRAFLVKPTGVGERTFYFLPPGPPGPARVRPESGSDRCDSRSMGVPPMSTRGILPLDCRNHGQNEPGTPEVVVEGRFFALGQQHDAVARGL